MLRFIILEDNKNFRERISQIVNKVMMPYNFEYKVSKFGEYNKEVEEIILNKNEQKIYILDVELPEISGLEISSEIRNDDLESIIIFITSHPECQNDIFYSRLLALDYINKDRLWSDRFEQTLVYCMKNINKKQVITFEFNHSSYRLLIDNIMYIEKVQDNQKCIIYTEDGNKYEMITTITNLKEKLGPNFYQTHKSCLVNVEKITQIDYADNTITFKNGKSVYLLSNRNKKGLREYVANY